MRSGSTVARWLVWSVLAALVLVTAALVAYAAVGRGAPTTTESPIPIDSFAPAPSYSPTPEPSDSAAPLPPLALAAESRLIVGVDARTAYRTSTVGCPADGDAVLQTTTDGGANWTDHPVAGAAGIRSIDPYTSTKTIAATVALPGCTLDYWRSFTSGVSWASQPSARADAVVVDPQDGTAVQRTAGAVKSPCAGIAAGALDADGGMAVICTDAVLYTSPADHLAAWVAPVLPGAAVGAVPSGDGYLVSLRRDADCPGLALVSLPASGDVQPIACLGSLTDETQPVALGTSLDGTLWLWVGDAIGSSTDGGTTWNGLS